MAGRLIVTTLNNDTGVLATQNGMTGIAKAWVNFDGTGTVAIRNSFNVSSITDNGTGDYTINFTTAMPNANYAYTLGTQSPFAGNSNNSITAQAATTSASALRIGTGTPSNSALADFPVVCAAVFSS